MRCRRPDLLPFALTLTVAAASGGPGGERAAAADAGPPFTDRTAASGLEFNHFNGMSGEHYLPEIMGSGAGVLDYDNDGDLDVYLVQGGMLGPGRTLADALFPPAPGEPPGDRLFRNDMVTDEMGRPFPRFVDVTATSGLVADGYGMGVATGDYDGDGNVDLYVTNFGPNQLWRNRGDGTFADVTAESGTDDRRWSVPAAFADLDGDGNLDLWLGNYLDLHLGLGGGSCTTDAGAPDYCGPLAYSPVPDRLLRNRGDGTFRDVTRVTGLDTAYGGALGIAVADFDGDGRLDLYVANDMTPNQLWLNRGDGKLANEAVLAGCAVNWQGRPEASMGTAVADFDADGDEDVFMTHLAGETNTLFVNDGSGFFTDRTLPAGLAGPSWSATGFGTAWIDYDNDRDLDLVAVNGAVRKIEELVDAGDPFPLHQPNQLFENLGGGRFAEVPAGPGSVFARSEVSRGLATGDVDNDGDADLLLSNNNGPARLLVNGVGGAGAWLGVRVRVGEGGRDAVGAAVSVAAGEPPLGRRRVGTSGSYGSAHDPRLLFGLGADTESATLTVTTADGLKRRWSGLPARRYYSVAAGQILPTGK